MLRDKASDRGDTVRKGRLRPHPFATHEALHVLEVMPERGRPCFIVALETRARTRELPAPTLDGGHRVAAWAWYAVRSWPFATDIRRTAATEGAYGKSLGWKLDLKIACVR